MTGMIPEATADMRQNVAEVLLTQVQTGAAERLMLVRNGEAEQLMLVRNAAAEHMMQARIVGAQLLSRARIEAAEITVNTAPRAERNGAAERETLIQLPLTEVTTGTRHRASLNAAPVNKVFQTMEAADRNANRVQVQAGVLTRRRSVRPLRKEEPASRAEMIGAKDRRNPARAEELRKEAAGHPDSF